MKTPTRVVTKKQKPSVLIDTNDDDDRDPTWHMQGINKMSKREYVTRQKSSIFIDSSDEEVEETASKRSSSRGKSDSNFTKFINKSKKTMKCQSNNSVEKYFCNKKPTRVTSTKTTSSINSPSKASTSKTRKVVYALTDSEDDIIDCKEVTPEPLNDPHLKNFLSKYNSQPAVQEKINKSNTVYDLNQPSTSKSTSSAVTSTALNSTNMSSKATVCNEDELMDYVHAILEENSTPTTMSTDELNALSSRINESTLPDPVVLNDTVENSVIDLSTITTPVKAFIDLSTPAKKTESKRNVKAVEVVNLDKMADNPIEGKKDHSPQKRLPECPICLENLNGKEIRATVCGHIFCKPCIEMSLKAAKKCPNCRKYLVKSKIFPLYL